MIVCTEDRNKPGMIQDEIPALVAAARQDPAAFARLYECYVQPIYRYAYSRLGSQQEAEDITSQTFMLAYESLPKYRERGHFAAWLFRIARSKITDHYRKDKRLADLTEVNHLADAPDTLGLFIQQEQLSRLRSLILGAAQDEQELVRLRYVADLSFAEMAQVLGKREDAVKKSLYRLLARLKSQME